MEQSENNVRYAGTHLLIDMYGASPALLGNVDYLRRACEDAAKACGATILGGHYHPFGEGYGVSGVTLLAESHISVHTWPERQYAAFDIFVCGKCDPQFGVPVLEDRFWPCRIEVKMEKRGPYSL